MLDLHCADATARLAAIYQAMSTPAHVAEMDADYWCRPDDPRADAATKKRRLVTQTVTFPPNKAACDRYVAPAHAFATSFGQQEGTTAASVLVAVAKCMSSNSRCKEARSLLAEAQLFLPALDASELTLDCR